MSESYLFAAIDELVTTLFREVFFAKKSPCSVDMLVSFVPLFARAILVLLRDTVQQVVPSGSEPIHKTVFLDLGLFAVGWDGITVDSSSSVLFLSLSFLLCDV